MAVFFLCGFSTVLNVILIPYLQSILDLQYTPIAFIQVSFYSAYFLFSPLAGYIFLKRTYLEGIRCGLFTGGLGALLIFAASTVSSFPLILLGIFVLGAGIAILQVTANPYTLLLGTSESASSRLTLAQSFTSVGTILAPFVGSICMLTHLCTPTETSHLISGSSLHLLYLVLALTWAAVLVSTYFLDLPVGKETTSRSDYYYQNETNPLKERFVLFGILGIGIATGVEVTIGSHLVKFLSDPEIADVSLSAAGKIMMLFWFGFFVGRVLGSRVLQNVPPENMLFRHALAGILFTAFTVIFSGYFAAISVLMLGLCISVMFPVIFSVVLEGCHSKKAAVSGFMCMANIGGALLPLTQGMLADRLGIHRSFVLPIAAFLYMVFYSLYLRNRAATLAPMSYR